MRYVHFLTTIFTLFFFQLLLTTTITIFHSLQVSWNKRYHCPHGYDALTIFMSYSLQYGRLYLSSASFSSVWVDNRSSHQTDTNRHHCRHYSMEIERKMYRKVLKWRGRVESLKNRSEERYRILKRRKVERWKYLHVEEDVRVHHQSMFLLQDLLIIVSIQHDDCRSPELPWLPPNQLHW